MGNGKNAYLQKREMERQIWTEVAERVMQQFMTDMVQISLNEELGLGYDTIMRVTNAWCENMKKYKHALNSKDPEADVAQEHIDRILTRIIRGKAELMPFKERYPELREVKYK